MPIEWTTKGLATLAQATEEFDAIMRQPGFPDVQEAAARKALFKFRSAMDYLEDTIHFEVAHERLDAAGRRVHKEFGCTLRHDAGFGYVNDCAVKLAHTRVGLSPDIHHTEMVCSICGQSAEDCMKHIAGERYAGEMCRYESGKSTIVHVHQVSRPKNPIARFMSTTLPYSDFESIEGFFEGTPLRCDQCATPCPGVTEVNLDGHGAVSLSGVMNEKSADIEVKAAGKFVAVIASVSSDGNAL